MVYRQRRGTAIVETKKGILVASGRKKIFLLPGGGAKRFESRRKAAIRELKEETGLNAYSTKFLFRHLGRVHKSFQGGHFRDHHKVFLVKAKGTPRPKYEIKYLAWYKTGSKIQLSMTTKEIIEKYYEIKNSNN